MVDHKCSFYISKCPNCGTASFKGSSLKMTMNYRASIMQADHKQS